MKRNKNVKNIRDKTFSELASDLRKDEVYYLRFNGVLIVLEFLIVLTLCHLIDLSSIESNIQYFLLISIVLTLSWICCLNWITLNCSKVPKWFYAISVIVSFSVIFTIVIIMY